MMKTVNFTEFRKNASQLFSRVEMGEAVEVTRHGKAIAVVRPIAESQERIPSWKTPGLRLTIPGEALSKTILVERERDR